jgi:ribose transport system substrate-binding protein
MKLRAIFGLQARRGSRYKVPYYLVVAGAAATVIAAAGCSSNASSASSQTQSPAASASASASASSVVVAGVPTLAQLANGFETNPPASGPAVAKGKTVWWISCGQSIPECSTPAASAQKAADELGWKFHIADGALDVNNGYPNAVRAAVAAHPDAIIVHGIDCAVIEQPLAEAKAAHIPVLGVEDNDCSTPLFTEPMLYSSKAPTAQDYFRSWGTVGAAYIIDKTDGHAKAIFGSVPSPLQTQVLIGFNSVFSKCTGCSIVTTITASSTGLTPGGQFQQGIGEAVVKYPTANIVYVPGDSSMNLAAVAVSDAHDKKVLVIGGTGGAESLVQVRDNVVNAITAAHSAEWMGYAAIDEVNRIFNNKPTVPEGVGVTYITATHGLPPAGSDYTPSINFEADYAKIWGLSG